MASPESFKEQRPVPKASFAEKVTFVGVGVLLAAAGWAIYSYSFRTGDDERPPVIVRNGSVRIEEVESDVRGSIKLKSGSTWYHEHTAAGPKRMDVEVTGTSSGCGTTGRFFASKIDNVVINYKLADGTARKVTFRADIPAKRIEIDVDGSASTSQPSNYILDLDGAGTTLVSAVLNRPGASKTWTCTLDPAANPQVRMIQGQ